MASDTTQSAPDDVVVDTLVANHRRFLEFLERRAPSRAVAEEILQAAFVKSMERADQLRDDESSIAWFYRLLRNAMADFYRHRDVERRALDREAQVSDDHVLEPELRNVVCQCIGDLIPELKPEYADLLRRIDLGEQSIAEAATELGTTANNVRVRLHRARKALKGKLELTCRTCATHGCLDCTCGLPSNTP